jgi:hypothetical protein
MPDQWEDLYDDDADEELTLEELRWLRDRIHDAANDFEFDDCYEP